MATILTLKETADLLKMEPASVYELTRARTRARHKHPLPVIRIGSALRFCKEDIEAWLVMVTDRKKPVASEVEIVYKLTPITEEKSA